jgi:COX assembly protein 1
MAGQQVKPFTKDEMYDKVKVVAPVVPRAVEEALIEKLRENSRIKCKDRVAAYAECTKDKTLSVAWACRDQLNNMNECLKLYTSAEQLDRLKVSWTKLQDQKKETPNK